MHNFFNSLKQYIFEKNKIVFLLILEAMSATPSGENRYKYFYVLFLFVFFFMAATNTLFKRNEKYILHIHI